MPAHISLQVNIAHSLCFCQSRRVLHRWKLFDVAGFLKVQAVQMAWAAKWFWVWWKLKLTVVQTHTRSTLSDTHTSFPETYLLSHTPRSLSNPPWWRLIATFRACWAPPVKARAPRAAPVCAYERETVPGQDPSRKPTTGWICGACLHSWTTDTGPSVQNDRHAERIQLEQTR